MLVLLAAVLPAVGGCVEAWKVHQITGVGQLAVPECAVVDAQTGKVYVSNMDTDSGAYWADDGRGALSLLAPGGAPLDFGWRLSSEDAPLHSPKGMCILNRVLYVADNSRVLGFPLSEAEGIKPLQGPRGNHLNDMATDGVAVYVSDTADGVVYRMADDGVTRIKAPEGVNGITFFRGRMYAVSWDLHDVYELDPTGQGDPVPFGLACHFKTPDGIEVLEDGTFLVSDMHGHRVAAVTPDRKQVYTLIALTTPADIGLDRDRRLLYVPQFERDTVSVWRLTPVKK
jgi:DNA-binding beta-propeller fold protein YncE